MSTSQIETEQLLNAAMRLSSAELEQFVARLFALKAREETAVLTEREAELLTHINQGVPSATQQRLNELVLKRQAKNIDAQELQELKRLTDVVEKADAERLKFLTELAHLRNVSLRGMIEQLGLKPVPH